MDAQRFLKLHTVKAGDFSTDIEVESLWAAIITFGFDLTVDKYIHDNNKLARCLTADLLGDYCSSRPQFIATPDGELIFQKVNPSRGELRDKIYKIEK